MIPTLLNKSIFRFIVVLFAVIPFVGLGQVTVTLQASGTGNTTGSWIVPCGVTSFTVKVFGGGGGGGSTATPATPGSGGGGGGYSTASFTSTPGTSFNYQCGGWGAGSNNAAPGGDGQTSWFSSATVLYANGGKGGKDTGSNSGTQGNGGGFGGTATGMTGSSGQQGSNQSAGIGGAGGNNGFGTGGGSQDNTADNNGNIGTIGGGGSGGLDGGGARDDGGRGGPGTIIITYYPTSAGSDVATATCGTTATMAATAPSSGSGAWSIAPAGPTITTASSPTTTVTNLTPGTNYTMTWTVTGTAPCTATTSTAIIYTSKPTANAGLDQTVCQSSFTMTANTPESGFTGTWSYVGAANGTTITNVNSPTTTVTGFVAGTCVTLRWTISGACSNTDDVLICYPNVCNDGPCGAFALTVNTSCSNTLTTNVGSTLSTGMFEPGCGTFLDNDVWYSAVVPANGTLTVTAGDNNYPTTPITASIAIYSGTCSNLVHQGCAQPSAAGGASTLNYSGIPGETIYIRVWDYFDLEAPFNICAFTTANVMGQMLTGNTNTITCGSSYTFTDPGGNGNYLDNQMATYTICPSTPGQFVSVNFSGGSNFFNLGTGDNLVVMNGPTSSSTIIYNLSGAVNPGTITSSDPTGCLTFSFMSNSFTTSTGWLASVSCTSTAGTNNTSTFCSKANCSGGCGTWFCGDGAYPTNNAVSSGVNELTSTQNRGCFGASGEVSSSWFYLQAETSGTVTIQFDGPNGQDYDFAVWGPTTNFNIPCPSNTGDGPIRCSYSGAANPVGIGNGATDFIEGAEGNGWVAPLNVIAGETYSLILNIYQNGGPQPIIDINVGGTASLDCTPKVVLPISLVSFEGINQGATNLLSWITESEFNNDYFTIYRSVNGLDWEKVGEIDAAGTNHESRFYSLRDNNPYFPICYYKLQQTDFDGQNTFSQIISVSTFDSNSEFISNLFPNPSSEFATFTFNGTDTKTPLNVKVVNELGATVQEFNYVTLHKGMPSTLRTFDLANGMYQVVFTQGNERQVQKLTILR